MDVSYVFSGTVGTAKTVLYEVSDNTNQAVGMSILSMSWGAGLILGPTFGGLYIKGKFTDSWYLNTGFI